MDVLTVKNITEIGGQVHPYLIFHPTSIAYIQYLLKSYAEIIEAASLDGIIEWIQATLSGKLREHALEQIIKAQNEKIMELFQEKDDIRKYENDPRVVVIVKRSLIEYLIADILSMAGYIADNAGDNTVLPWDIQKAIADDEEFSKMFGINVDQTQLPVTIIVNTRLFTHMLSIEFTIGLLLFSYVVKHDFYITMFRAPFTAEYIDPMPQIGENQFMIRFRGHTHTYQVDVGVKTYRFDTPDFMQGFATGALWMGVDHHDYWSNLFIRTIDPNTGVVVLTRMNF